MGGRSFAEFILSAAEGLRITVLRQREAGMPAGEPIIVDRMLGGHSLLGEY